MEALRYFTGRWGMKQRGKTVTSTMDSLYKFKSKVKGNQLEGRIVDEFNRSHHFILKNFF